MSLSFSWNTTEHGTRNDPGAPQRCHVDSEDLVEFPFGETRVFEGDGLEDRLARGDVFPVPSFRHLDHRVRAIDRSQRTAAELSQTSEAATPWPQPISSTRSAGSMARVSTAQAKRSETLLAMLGPYP